jgi:hypothetical protein
MAFARRGAGWPESSEMPLTAAMAWSHSAGVTFTGGCWAAPGPTAQTTAAAHRARTTSRLTAASTMSGERSTYSPWNGSGMFFLPSLPLGP